MNRGLPAVLAVLGIGAAAGIVLPACRRESAEETGHRVAAAEARARKAEQARDEALEARAAAEREMEKRIEALRRQLADLEEARKEGERREGDLRAAAERSRREAQEEARKRQESEAEAARLRAAAERPPEAPEPPPVPSAERPAEKPPADKPPPDKPAGKPPVPGLGPTAVTDPNQVRKLTDGLNALLAGVGGAETWRIVSAAAVEDDRLVQAVLEARGAGGAVAKSFQAQEARFVLQTAAGTLALRFKEGAVTYPGNRTIPFPGGVYTVLLVVDPAPFRASGNPLVAVQ